MKVLIGVLIAALIAVGIFFYFARTAGANVGPYGGDLIPLDDPAGVQAEVLARQETGEVMLHTWNRDLNTAHPIEAKSITMGSGDESIVLEPHPMPGDPPGYCSRFYGRTDWMMGGRVQSGWIRRHGAGSERSFNWKNCWEGGAQHGSMWSEVSQHGPMGGPMNAQGAGPHRGEH